MNFPIKLGLPLLGLFTASPQASAELVTLLGDSLIFSYETASIYNMGDLEVVGDQLQFHPSLSISIESQTSDYAPTTVYAYSSPYSAVIDVRAKPGFRIDNHQITSSGYKFQGNGIAEPYTSISSSSTPLPLLTISGELYLESTGYYLYDAPGGIREEPIYEYQTITEIIGYTPDFDEFGNIIGQTPIYDIRQEEVIVGYNSIETFYPVYKIDGAGIGLSDVTVDFQVSAIPLPPAAWLFLGGLVMTGISSKRLNKSVKTTSS